MSIKKMSAFFVMIMVIIAAGVCAHAVDFEVVGGTTLPEGRAYEPYEYTIQMSEPGDYSFSFSSGVLPFGLTLESTGKISGIPKASGFYTGIYIRVTNLADNTSEIVNFSMNLKRRFIYAVLSMPDEIVYDGQPHAPDVKFYDMDGTELPDIVPTITYGENYLKQAINVGKYYINLDDPSGCKIQNIINSGYINIIRADVASISVRDIFSAYDGKPHGVKPGDVTTLPENISYISEYKLENEPDSSYSQTEPVNSGTYSVRVTTNDSNYNTAKAYSTMEIGASYINFTVTGWEGEHIYNQSPLNEPTITPSVEGFTNFTVKYLDASGNEIEGLPVNAGTYTVDVRLGEDSGYILGRVFSNTVTIDPCPVSYDVRNNEYPYDGQEHQATVNVFVYDPSGTINISSDNYEVKYQKEGEEAQNAAVTGGYYKIIVNITNPNYELDDEEHNEILYIMATPKLNLGNSPGAMIYKSQRDEDWKYNAYEYLKGNLKFNEEYLPDGLDISVLDITFTPIGGLTLDVGPSTVIVNNIEDFQDPGLVLEDGVENETIQGSEPYPTETEGVYVVYYYKYTSVAVEIIGERYIIELKSKIGDANGNGTVNAIDANIINLYISTNTAEFDSVQKARVYNVNKDNTLDKEDVYAIQNRFSKKLTPYYPWL